MDTRMDLQRLLEDMDRVIKRKQAELAELDERLEASREKLSQKEAEELQRHGGGGGLDEEEDGADESNESLNTRALNERLKEQQAHYEQQLSHMAAEFAELDATNLRLIKHNERLETKSEALHTTNETLKAKVFMLSKSQDELRNANFELNIRLAKAESELLMQQKLMKKSHDQDQVLMEAFNDKVESLKQALAVRDDEIKRLRLDNQLTLDSFGVRIDFNNSEQSPGLIESGKKKRIIEVVSLLKQKDHQIELLTNQLMQASRDLENNANLIESYTRSANFSSEGGKAEAQRTASEGYCAANGRDELVVRCKMLDKELEAKDEQLHLVESRNRHLESIVPNEIATLIDQLLANYRQMSEQNQATNLDRTRVDDLTRCLNQTLAELSSTKTLLNETEQLKRVISAKDRQIERFVRELNELDERLHGPAYSPPPATDEFESSKKVDTQQSNMATRQSANLIVRQKSLVKEQTEPNVSEDSNHEIDADASSSAKLTPSSTDDYQTPKGMTSAPVRPRTRQNSFSTAKFINFRSRAQASKRDTREREPSELKTRLEQVEQENQLLELAMKEILVSIKIFDSSCDTLMIDCPSLERLCQLIEAKYMSNSRSKILLTLDRRPDDELPATGGDISHTDSDLFQLVVMKGELDLLRGQNEQLRSELKILRSEWHHSLINDQQNRLSNSDNAELDSSKQHNQQANGAEPMTKSETSQTEPNDVDSERDQARQQDLLEKCTNCSRLVKLAQHLLDCIARIESRVSISDETYIKRLVAIHQLTQQLGKDLTQRETTIGQLRAECNRLTRQSLINEAKCQSLETQLVVHFKICPMTRTSVALADFINNKSVARGQEDFSTRAKGVPVDFQLVASSSHHHHHQTNHSVRLAEQRNSGDAVAVHSSAVSQQRADHSSTIAMLQSIIACLQARLDFKDERLEQLEQMLTAD